MNELALFAGVGGGILGGKLLGWKTVCAVEIEPYCQRILMQRQDDGILDPFPIWGDIRTFDGKPWAGKVDVVSGGFPCQDISAAGKGAGIDGAKSGLWREMARVIGEVRPRYAFVENSPVLTSRGLGRVLGDLAEMGYDARWGVLGVGSLGGSHIRERIWIVAYTDEAGLSGLLESYAMSVQSRYQARFTFGGAHYDNNLGIQNIPESLRMDDGVSDRVDRVKSLGNSQVPIVAATAWRILSGRI